MQLRVIKRDGSSERYLHTKVLGTFNNVLVSAGEADIIVAEQFAEAVTYHLYHKNSKSILTSKEIHSLIRSVLVTTGCDEAVYHLDDWRVRRELGRKRIEVISDSGSEQWDKSHIACDLVTRDGLDEHVARAVASAVEEKILNMGVTHVRKMLIRQIVLADAASMAEASRQLEMAG
ncbi:MAG: hypothetical protein KAS23_17620 [Anaerohalosphaera sp.]|nr:hypothetical protein [Anaerohalosphaera sp.]